MRESQYLPRKKLEGSEKHPPKAMILEEYTLESDPWRTLRDTSGIRIINTTRRIPGE